MSKTVKQDFPPAPATPKIYDYNVKIHCQSLGYDLTAEHVAFQREMTAKARKEMQKEELSREGVGMIKAASDGFKELLPYVTSKAPILQEVKHDHKIVIKRLDPRTEILCEAPACLEMEDSSE